MLLGQHKWQEKLKNSDMGKTCREYLNLVQISVVHLSRRAKLFMNLPSFLFSENTDPSTGRAQKIYVLFEWKCITIPLNFIESARCSRRQISIRKRLSLSYLACYGSARDTEHLRFEKWNTLFVVMFLSLGSVVLECFVIYQTRDLWHLMELLLKPRAQILSLILILLIGQM